MLVAAYLSSDMTFGQVILRKSPQPVAVEGVPLSVVGVIVTNGFDSADLFVVLTATCLFIRFEFCFLLPKEAMNVDRNGRHIGWRLCGED